MPEVSIEIEKVDNGYILKKAGGWTLTETFVFSTFNELVEKMCHLFGEKLVVKQ